MKIRYLLLLISGLFLMPGSRALSQMVGDNIFLQGAFVEIGIAPNGGFGSTVQAPAGFHPNNPGGDIFYDPGAATVNFLDSNLGFVADYDANGWTVAAIPGDPPYFGDYYLPGDPQEGWAIEVNGQESDAYIPAYMTTPTTGFTGFGGTGAGGLSGTNISYSNAGGVIKGIWHGVDSIAGGGTLGITQTTVLDTSKLYFTVTVVLTNTGTVPLNNIYYLRTVDPDNDQTYSGSYTTINTIADQLPNPENKVLVSATGTQFLNAYLGLGTKDCRAKCMVYIDNELAPEYSIDSLYSYEAATGYYYQQSHVDTDDVGIGLSFNIGTIAPGDSTMLAYAYILNATYIDSALNSTRPAYYVNTNSFDSSDTVNVCAYPYDSININIQNGGFYHWTWAPDSFIHNTTGTSNVVYQDSILGTPITSLTYTITGINAAGGCDSIVYHLTIQHAFAPAPVMAPVAYCQYDTAIPLIPPAGTPVWWTVPVGGSGSTTPPTPSTAVPGTTIYYVSETNGYCQSLRGADTVTVAPQPATPYVTDPTPYCYGFPFVPFTTIGDSIRWYLAATGGTGSNIAPVINTDSSGTYINYATQTVKYYVPEDSIYCESPRQLVSVTVLDSISPSFTPHLHYGCVVDTVVFDNTSTSMDPLHYLWTFGDGTNDTAADPTHVYYSQGTFTVILTAINGACSKNDTDTVAINHSFVAGFTYSPGVVCQQSPVTFTDTSSGVGLSYLWLFGDGGTSTSPAVTYTYNNEGVYNVSLIVSDFVPCHDTVNATIYVDTMSGVNIALTDSVICQGTYITFNGLFSGIGNTGVTWFFGNGDSVLNANPVSYAYYVPGTYVVSVTAGYRACRDTGTSRTIVVIKQPTINLGNDTSICAGSTALTLADNINAGTQGASWLWNTGQTTPAITVNTPGYYYATVNVDNCYATDTIWVQNDCYMDIPNAFSPNNDGVNDYFYPRQYLTKGLISFKMDIYNRWGQLIFETTSLDGSGWDGKLNNTDQPNGVYIYVIDGTFKDGQKEHHQGNVTLLR